MSAAVADGRLLPRLHVVTDDSVLATARWVDRASVVLEAGGAAVALHVRGPRTSGRLLFERAQALTEVARRTGSLLVVNDRIDVALAAGVPAVHLGRRSLPVASVKPLVGPDRLIGVSAHGGSEVAEAADAGADYVFVGTVFPTPSHRGLSGIAPSGLRDALGRAPSLPAIGIGGVSSDRVEEVLAAGAWGVAVVRGVWAAKDPARAVRAYRKEIEAAT